MRSLAWTSDLTTGVGQFDDDHRHLLGIYNELFAACFAGLASTVIADILERLLSYTNDHFRREEEAMRQTRFPGLAEHEAAHDGLVMRLSELRQSLQRGSIDNLDVEALAFLEHWIVTHTLEMDRAYGEHLNSHGFH
ncbi:MAG: bacteriohemerythrin [Actinomycetota bacterium]